MESEQEKESASEKIYAADGVTEMKLNCNKKGVKGAQEIHPSRLSGAVSQTKEALASYHQLHGHRDIYWNDLEVNCDRLLEANEFVDEDHKQDILKFRHEASVCKHNMYIKSGSWSWIPIGRFRDVKSTQCPKCMTIVPKHKFAKHLRERKCETKHIENYMYLKLRGLPVCPVCVRTFKGLSELQLHM